VSWPWVSRAALEAERVARQRLEGELAAERARYGMLVDTIVELKREGFMPPPRPEALEPQVPELPEAILLAIGQRALPKSDLERELLRWAGGQMRRDGADPELIARQILRGGASDYEEE
jgi:hypothetical protein